MKQLLLTILVASGLLSACGADFNVSLFVGSHDHPDDFPITLTQISACPDSGNGSLSDVFGCMTGSATGQVSYSNQICWLDITESGRIRLGISDSSYSESFYIYQDNADYTKLPGSAPGSFELNARNPTRNFSLFVAWPGSATPSAGTIATMSVSIGSLSCNFLL